jgi:hypothetical protein
MSSPKCINITYWSKKYSYKVVVKLPDLKGNSVGLIIFHKTQRYKVSWKSLNNSSKLFVAIMVKEGKAKFMLEQATKAQRGSRGIVLLFL